MPLTLFFAYSHRDEKLRDKLDVHLSMLKREGLIDPWYDRRITPGAEVDSSISDELEQAQIILLLVSADFLASRYCMDVEMRRAMEKHEKGLARVIPIILRPCDWHSAPFGSLNAVPKDGKPVRKFRDLDDAFLEVTLAVRAAAKAALARSSGSPRPGGVGVGTAPTYPAAVIVGDKNVWASVTVTNTSTLPRGTVTLGRIRHTPSAGTDSAPCPPGQADPGVFLVKGILPGNKAAGRLGTASAGMTFTIGPADVTTGEVEFIPDNGSVVLEAPGRSLDTCAIDFLVDVLRLPTMNAGHGPGIQTAQLVRVSGTASINGVTGTNTGSCLTVVHGRATA